MPKLFKKLREMLESMGERAKKRSRFCKKERIIRGEVVSVSDRNGGTVATPMAFNSQ